VILSNPFNQQEFTGFVKDFLPNFKLDVRKIEPGNSGFREVLRIGSSSDVRTEVLIVRSSKNINSRISLTNNSFRILKTYSIYRALIVYVNDDETIWRLSLLTATPTLSPDGKTILTLSNPRRHSYVLGTDVGIATARKYLSSMGKIQDFADLEFRFSVEVVNRDFYKEIAGHFYNLVGLHGQNGEVKIEPLLKLPSKKAKIEDSHNYAVRLLGRIIFSWFLRNKFSQNSVALMPPEVLGEGENSKDILHSYLEPVFFEVLNRELKLRNNRFRNELHDLVPYLNGGLFHASDGEGGDYYDQTSMTSNIVIPDSWFVSLYQTLKTYNFTIDENLENDVDLSIDPEMLGRVFENLLAEINPETGQVARKSTGSYYTPRAIVNFMVDEALVSYLKPKTGLNEKQLRDLLSTVYFDSKEIALSQSEKLKIVKAVKEIECLDPACGSGAFPMSVLHKLLWIISKADPDGDEFIDSIDYEGTETWLSPQRLDYLRKRKIIRDNLYGLDIQSVAVEIAKLRCFLTLIVDQEIDDDAINRGVVPLPNLDFKFICADSLTPLNEDKQLSFGDDPDLEEKLTSIRKRYFATNDEPKKEKLRSKYAELVSSDPKLFEASTRNKQLSSFKPFESNNQAFFFDPHTMFGVNGFNLIVGNPPYVVLRDKVYKPLVQHLRSIPLYSYAQGGNLNLYRHFIERSIRLLNVGGVLSFIVPSTLIADRSSSGIRRMFKEMSKTDFIVEFPENAKIFESITQATTIFLLSRSAKVNPKESFYISIGNNNSTLPPDDRVIVNWDQIEKISGTDLALPMVKSDEEIQLIMKLRSQPRTLDNYVTVYEGDIHQTKHAAFMSDSKQNRLLVVGNHISHFNVDLDPSKKTKRWFKYAKEHSFATPERIVIQGIANMGQRIRIKGSIIPEGIVVGNSANCVERINSSYSYHYILGLLSSELANWFFRKFSTNNNVNAYEVLAIPFAEPKSEARSQIEKCVKKIMKLAENQNYESIECNEVVSEMNNLFFEIYGLTKSEILLIQRS